jgi:hypothetical protein
MARPSRGQPYTSPGLRFSIGDPAANPGSPAWTGVTVNAGGGDVSPPTVISTAATVNFTLTTLLRGGSDIGPGWFAAAMASPATVQHTLVNIATGAALPAVAGGGVAAAAAPTGASAPAAGEVVNWFSDTTAAIPTPALGTYRVLTEVHGSPPFFNQSLAAFHEDTIIMVTP